MATENAVMAAVLAQGETVIGNAACEPHVQDLCRFLVALGARIEGIGSNVLRIDGVERLRGGEWAIGPDHIEVGSFIGLAAVTGGDVTIEGVGARRPRLDPARRSRGSASASRSGSDSVHVPARQELVVQDDLGGKIPKIEDGPWPAFPADLTSIAVTVATQARGTVLIFEKMFESRLFFIDKLVWMGARIILCDPHRAVVTGPAQLVRPADGEPGHPRRHGDAARRALRRGAVDDRRRARSTGATSASTSGCARSARTSSASKRSAGRAPVPRV